MDVYRNTYCSKIIITACCLHNICVDNGDNIFDEPLTYEFVNDENHQPQISTNGSSKLDMLCQTLIRLPN